MASSTRVVHAARACVAGQACWSDVRCRNVKSVMGMDGSKDWGGRVGDMCQHDRMCSFISTRKGTTDVLTPVWEQPTQVPSRHVADDASLARHILHPFTMPKLESSVSVKCMRQYGREHMPHTFDAGLRRGGQIEQ